MKNNYLFSMLAVAFLLAACFPESVASPAISNGKKGNTTDYCLTYSNFPWEDWIAKVELANLSAASGKSVYSNFTGQTAYLAAGQNYPVALTTSFSYFTWDEYWRIWIDLNHDYDFDDAGEMVFEGVKTKPANGTATATLTGSLNIPASALAGPTRMRVSMKRNCDPAPCENLAFGEVEDYTVNIMNNFVGGTENRAANLAFEAVREKTWVQLSGLFHSAEAVEAMVIEKSADGISYEILEIEPGQLQPDVVEVMRIPDKSPLDGFNFYRMKILLENGNSLYSPVRIITFDKPLDFTVFPNPASSEIFIQLDEPPSGETTWTVYDAFGRAIWSQLVGPDTAFPYRLDTQAFDNGMYYLYARRYGGRAVAVKFIVSK